MLHMHVCICVRVCVMREIKRESLMEKFPEKEKRRLCKEEERIFARVCLGLKVIFDFV